MNIKRIPNAYDTVLSAEVPAEEVPTIMENPEFTQFTSGQTHQVSAEARVKIKNALRSQGAKLDMFLAAYSQKGAFRLTRIMRVLDSVDKELFQEWRMKVLDTGTLLDVFSDLSTEQHRQVKELADISDRFRENRSFGSPSVLDTQGSEDLEGTRAAGQKLTRKSKKNLLKFFKNRIAV